MTRWLPLGLVFLLAGCGSSPPTQFYTLDPIAPPRAARATTGMPVQIVAVHIPAALDRQEMVRESAPHHLEVSDKNRWGGSLDTMIRRVLTQDLAQRLPSDDVVLPQEPAPRRHAALVIDILQFDRDASGNVIFDGSWSLTDAGADEASLNRHLRLSVPSSSQSYGDQAAAMSRILGELADNIAGGLGAAHAAR